MAVVRDFRKLKVWEKGHLLTIDIYQLTHDFPREELYGLVSQMRRSASSIPTNLAEGCGRGTEAELARFMQISMGSASELEYQLLLSKDLGFVDDETYAKLNNQVLEVKKMLGPFIKRLRGR